MARTTVEVDDELLKEALRVTGEDMPAEVVERGLMEVIRVAKLKQGIQWLQATKDVFWPNYLEQLRPNSWAAMEKRGETPEVREAGDLNRGHRPR